MTRDTIRTRVAAATEGPWVGYAIGSEGAHVSKGTTAARFARIARLYDRTVPEAEADATFIAHARQDIPALLAVADAAAAVIARCDICATTDDACRSHWDLKPALEALEALP